MTGPHFPVPTPDPDPAAVVAAVLAAHRAAAEALRDCRDEAARPALEAARADAALELDRVARRHRALADGPWLHAWEGGRRVTRPLVVIERRYWPGWAE